MNFSLGPVSSLGNEWETFKAGCVSCLLSLPVSFLLFVVLCCVCDRVC